MLKADRRVSLMTYIVGLQACPSFHTGTYIQFIYRYLVVAVAFH